MVDLSDSVNCTLPIEFNDGLTISPSQAKEFGENLAGLYCFSEPYPHIAIDNFLPNELIEQLF
jgi:hypothetical protein